MRFKVTVVIQKEENWYVAKCLENSVASQGKTVEEAMSNLKEAIGLYYEDMPQESHLDNPVFITTLEVTV